MDAITTRRGADIRPKRMDSANSARQALNPNCDCKPRMCSWTDSDRDDLDNLIETP